jgi:hypothetical protein
MTSPLSRLADVDNAAGTPPERRTPLSSPPRPPGPFRAALA